MEIRVSGHQVDTGEALRAHAAERLTAIAVKYAARITSAQVTFGKGPHDHGFTCEIIAYIPQDVLKATDRAATAHAAFDATAEKIATQLRRHARRLKDHHASDPVPTLEDIDGGGRRGGA